MGRVVKALEQMKELLAPEGAWTQHAMARTKTGYSIRPFREGAVSFCLLGAKVKVLGYGYDLESDEYSEDLHKVLQLAVFLTSGAPSVASFNDRPETTKRDVLAVIDRAIRIAQEQKL